MVPGLYLYRAFYNLGTMSLVDAFSWGAAAIMIIIALPLGLIFARIFTDRTSDTVHDPFLFFTYCTRKDRTDNHRLIPALSFTFIEE